MIFTGADCAAINGVSKMKLHIREVKKCKGGDFGNFVWIGQQSARINISMSLNTNIAEYSATLLHELLHLWLSIMRSKGFKLHKGKEHKFVYAVERVITDAFVNLKSRRIK